MYMHAPMQRMHVYLYDRFRPHTVSCKQEIMRGGIDVRANLNYALTVQLTGNYKLYQGPVEFCLVLLHSWPDNNVEVYPYYQYKKLKWTDTGFVRIVRDPYIPLRICSVQLAFQYKYMHKYIDPFHRVSNDIH